MARHESRTFGKAIIAGASNGTMTVQLEDDEGNALMCRGSALPAAGASGYAVGCIFNITGSGGGLFINGGSTTSASFTTPGTSPGTAALYQCIAAKSTVTSGGDTTETVTIAGVQTTDYVLGQYSVSDDSDTIAEMTITAEDTITYVASADPIAAHTADTLVFRKGGNAAWDIFAHGSATSAGGDATETVTITGALATDKVLVTVTDDGTNSVTISDAKMTANTLTVVFSGDPSSDATFDYVVFRPAGSFAPTAKIAAMGQYTSIAGDTTTVGPFTATGVLATDTIILIHATSDDTDTIQGVVPAAGTITLTVSADPVTDHSYTWMAVRDM